MAKIVDRETLKTIREKFQEKIESGNIIAGISRQIENVSPESGTIQTAPFRFEATGTDDNTTETATAPIAKHLELRGNTVSWNQLIQNGNFDDVDSQGGPTYWGGSNSGITISNNVASVYANSTASQYCSAVQNALKVYKGHTYLLKFDIDVSALGGFDNLSFAVYEPTVLFARNLSGDERAVVFTAPSSGERLGILMAASSGNTLSGYFTMKNIQLFDLSEIYGVGKEPTGTDEEILQHFNRDFPLPYYEYNTGTLLSCQSNKLTTIGYNAFDGELEQGGIDNNGQSEVNANAVRSKNFIKVIAGQTYTLEETTSETVVPYLVEYDGNKNFIKTTAYTTDIELTSDTHFVKFYSVSSSALIPTNIESVVFNITWDSSRTGYEQYSKHEYTLPDVELKSAYNAYDEIKPDGTKITRVGSYTITGNETFLYDVNIIRMTVPSRMDAVLPAAITDGEANICVGGYMNKNNFVSTDGAVRAYSHFVWFKNTFLIDPNKTDEENKQALIDDITGRILYYELATPAETQTTSFTENIEVDDFGTLEFESTSTETSSNPIIPQGNKMFFPADYVLLLDDLNNYTDGDITKLALKSDLNTAIGDINTILDAINGEVI